MTRTGHPFIELTTVESTNIYAMEQARARLAGPGTAFFAHEQTRGRGQRGRQWHARPGENIALSLIVEPPDKNPARGFPLSCATAMGCYDFFKNLVGDETAIKWPNDLYWRDRKAGGILIENIIRAGVWELAIVGIGININQVDFDPSLPNPVSLRQITGRSFRPVDLARELCDCLDRRWQSLANGQWPGIFAEYQEILYGRGRTFRFRSGDEAFEARVSGVSEDGQLEVSDGRFRLFPFGQLEWLSLQPLD
jgi:BirA family biotin operon repressor/biotin-[acetyl-CoA-carboxylase] ligase